MLVPWRISRVRIRIVFFCCACHNYWRFSWGLHLGLEDTRGTALPSMSWVSGFDMPRHELSQKTSKNPWVVRSMPLWTRPHFWDVWTPAVKNQPAFFFQSREGVATGRLGVEVSELFFLSFPFFFVHFQHLRFRITLLCSTEICPTRLEVSPKLLARTRGQSVTLSSPQDFFAVEIRIKTLGCLGFYRGLYYPLLLPKTVNLTC